MERTLRLIQRAHEGDKEARDILVEENVGLVWSIVRRFQNRGVESEDLFQIGTIGLIKAVDKFDCNYEVCFSTYAVPLITGEIKRFIRDDGLVKVSRTLKENGSRGKYARERLLKSLGREPTLEEVALEAALTTEEVILAMEAGARVESIYQSVYQSDGNEIYLVDQLADEKGDEQEKLLDRLLVKQLLKSLPEMERTLITLRYFRDKTQTEVAGLLGISQVQVSRMEKKILLGLRERMI